MALTDEQKQKLTEAWNTFMRAPDSAQRVKEAGENPAFERTRNPAVDKGDAQQIAGFISWMTIHAVSDTNLQPTMELLNDRNERREVEAHLLSIVKTRNTLFTIPGLNLPVTTGTLVGAGAGGVLSVMLGRILGEQATEGIMGTLLPIIGIVGGGFLGTAIQNGFSPPPVNTPLTLPTPEEQVYLNGEVRIRLTQPQNVAIAASTEEQSVNLAMIINASHPMDVVLTGARDTATGKFMLRRFSAAGQTYELDAPVPLDISNTGLTESLNFTPTIAGGNQNMVKLVNAMRTKLPQGAFVPSAPASKLAAETQDTQLTMNDVTPPATPINIQTPPAQPGFSPA